MLYTDTDPETGKQTAVRITETMVPMPDGVKLYTMLLTPDADGTFPIIIERNPYVKTDPDLPGVCRQYIGSLRAGYAVVSQHCRGCGRSEGDCEPYLHERQDGLALLDWIRKLPVYQKELYLWGGSYLSSVHYSYLNTNPPDVKGAVLGIQEVNRYNIIYRNGFCKIGLHGGWCVGMFYKNSIKHKNYVPEMYRTLPMEHLDEAIFGRSVPAFLNPLRHPWPEDPYWQTEEGGVDYLSALDKLDFPILFITAFYDIYTEGVLEMWNQLSPSLKAKSALIVTPYSHGFDDRKPVVEFPASHLRDLWPDHVTHWFEAIRGKEKLDFVTPGNITWYEQFAGKWHTAPSIPDGPQERIFYLNDDKLETAPAAVTEKTYVYNPFAPAPFNGGCCNNFGGMQIQDPPNSRYDILSFLSAPFTEEVRLQGRMELELQVRSDCPDTCFYARMSLVKNGVAYGMRDDIVSMKRQIPDYRPGDTGKLRLNFACNAVRLAPGDIIRLDISSSCWPHFLPHTNRVGNPFDQTGADIAHNTVFCGVSRLTVHCR